MNNYKFRFGVGDKVRVATKNRVFQPILNMHGTVQEIEAVFGGGSPYRVKGHVFLFREEELELVSRAGFPVTTNVTPHKPTEVTGSALVTLPSSEVIHFMKRISEV